MTDKEIAKKIVDLETQYKDGLMGVKEFHLRVTPLATELARQLLAKPACQCQ